MLLQLQVSIIVELYNIVLKSSSHKFLNNHFLFSIFSELKPFIECSIVQRIIPHSDVKQFKYLRVLMQEFHVKVDLLFINEIVELVNTEVTEEESVRHTDTFTFKPLILIKILFLISIISVASLAKT